MISITIAGRLGKDAELRTTQGGKDVLSFTVAVDQGFGDKKRTLWVNCAMWGERAAKVEQYLTKGTQLTVIGNQADIRTWESNGKSGASLEITVSDFKLQGGGERQEGGQQTPASSGGWGADIDDDEIPF